MKPIINLMLGTACNRNCSYCMQPRQGSNGKVDIDSFLDKLIPYLKAHYPNGLQTIEYWGGEPLLYFEYIKKIQAALQQEKIYIDRRPRIITNGTLATQDFVDFCNDQDLLVNLSWHDGSIEKDKLILLLQIKHFYISNVITHQHLDLEEDRQAWEYIGNTLGRYVSWQLYPVHCTDHCSRDAYFTEEDIDWFFTNLKEKLKTDDLFYKYILKHFYYYYVYKKIDILEPKCYGQRKLSLDLYGNRYYCHHIMIPENIAYNIFSKSIPIVNEKPYDRWFKTKECQDCPNLQQCLGSCYLSNAHNIECYWFKSAYKFCKENYEVQN